MDEKLKRKNSEPTPLNINLRKAREERGETQAYVAYNLNMTVRMLRWYETSGSIPPYNRLIALAEYYGKSMNELFGATKSTQKKDVPRIGSEAFTLTSRNPKERGFYVKSDLQIFTPKRIRILTILFENPDLIDSVAGFINGVSNLLENKKTEK